MSACKETLIKSTLKDCAEHFEHNEKLDFFCIGYEVVVVNKQSRVGEI